MSRRLEVKMKSECLICGIIVTSEDTRDLHAFRLQHNMWKRIGGEK